MQPTALAAAGEACSLLHVGDHERVVALLLQQRYPVDDHTNRQHGKRPGPRDTHTASGGATGWDEGNREWVRTQCSAIPSAAAGKDAGLSTTGDRGGGRADLDRRARPSEVEADLRAWKLLAARADCRSRCPRTPCTATAPQADEDKNEQMKNSSTDNQTFTAEQQNRRGGQQTGARRRQQENGPSGRARDSWRTASAARTVSAARLLIHTGTQSNQDGNPVRTASQRDKTELSSNQQPKGHRETRYTAIGQDKNIRIASTFLKHDEAGRLVPEAHIVDNLKTTRDSRQTGVRSYIGWCGKRRQRNSASSERTPNARNRQEKAHAPRSPCRARPGGGGSS